MAEPFLTMEQAGAELGVADDQLREFISRGELRAFSDAGSFKFRRSDLEAFKRKHPQAAAADGDPSAEEPVVILPEEEAMDAAVVTDAEIAESGEELLDAETAEEIPDAPQESAVAESGDGDVTAPLPSLPPEPETDPEIVPEEVKPEGEPDLTETLTDAQEISLDELEADDSQAAPPPAKAKKPAAAASRPAAGPKGARKPAHAEAVTEEISLDEPTVSSTEEIPDPSAGGSATEELLLSDEVGLAPTEDIVAGEGVTAQVTQPIDLEEAGMSTDPLSMEDLPEAGEGAEELAGPKIPRMGLSRLQGVRQRKQGSPAWAVLAVLSCAMLAFSGSILIGWRYDFVPGYLLWVLDVSPPNEQALMNAPPGHDLPPIVPPADLVRDYNYPSPLRIFPPPLPEGR